MYRNRLLQTLVAAGLCAIFIVAFAPQIEAKSKYTITAVTAWPIKTYMGVNFMWFVNRANELAAKKYPGQLEIKYLGGPKAIPRAEQIDALRGGFVDMNFTAASYVAPAVPLLDALSMTDYMPWEEREKGVNDFLQPFHKESINAYFFSRMGGGMNYQIFTTKPVETLADLKGLRLRASPSMIPFSKAVNAVTVVYPPPKIYGGIENGDLDGFLWPQGNIVDWKWEKVIKYMVEPITNYHACDITLMNLDTWNNLPKHLQKLLIQAVIDAEKQLMNRAEKYISEKYPYIQKAGVKVAKLSEAEGQKMLKLCRDELWAQLIEVDPENAKKLRSMITK